MPLPAGILKAAPSARTGPCSAEWSWIFQLAVFMACQMPLKSGFLSAVRGMLAAACPAAGVIVDARITTPIPSTASTPVARFFIRLSPRLLRLILFFAAGTLVVGSGNKGAAVRQCHPAACGDRRSVLRAISLDGDDRAGLDGVLGEATADERVRGPLLDGPLHDLTVRPLHVDV